MKRTPHVVPTYHTSGGVCMAGHDSAQEITIVHTVPRMTQQERQEAEKRAAADLYDVLSDIYKKLSIESE
jgi:hypothetical protein